MVAALQPFHEIVTGLPRFCRGVGISAPMGCFQYRPALCRGSDAASLAGAFAAEQKGDLTMVRVVLAVAVAAVSVTVVSAQSSVLPSTAAMKEMSQPMYGVLNRRVKGEMPYDQAKANEAIAKLANAAPKIPQAFPATSKGKTSPDTRYSASPKVWENRADFEEYATNLAKAIADNRGKVTSLEGLKAAYPQINDACNGCHQDYRLRKS
jgi:cytochrome c556